MRELVEGTDSIVSEMLIKEINLVGFRNYLEVRVLFDYNKVIIIGKNAQGKTNLLEVVQILSGLKSQRAKKDAELINFSLETAIIHAKFCRDNSSEDEKISVLIRPSGRRSIKVNEVTKSNRELSRHINSVSFMSHDLELITGSPSTRRTWLDNLVTQLDSSYDHKLSEFEKILSQRNGYITKLVESGVYYTRLNPSQQEEFRLWNELYIKHGNEVIATRKQALTKLEPLAASYYSKIADNHDEVLSFNYLGEELSQAILDTNLRADFARMHTTVGPQRHDLEIYINQKLSSSFASQGQRRSIVLALKLAELDLLREEHGTEPILLLDDVLAELDEARQAALLAAIKPETQVLITTTELGDHLNSWSSNAQIIEISNGRIQEQAKV